MEWAKIMNAKQNAIQNAMKAILPKKYNTKRKNWMANDILQKMGQRRRYKSNGKERYNEINKEIQSDFRKVKENYINKKPTEIEEMGKQSRLREMHSKMKMVISGTNRNRSSCI